MPPKKPTPPPQAASQAVLLLILLVLMQVLAGFAWLYVDNRLPEGETETHLVQAGLYREALFGDDAGTLLNRLVRVGDIPPSAPPSPLLAFLGGIGLEVTGGLEDAPAAVSVLALALLLFAAYALARCVLDPMMALRAATLTGLLPLLYAASRIATPDMLLTALLLWSLFAVVRSDGFRRGGWVFLGGLLAGLALLASPTAWIYLVPLAIIGTAVGLLGIAQDSQRGAAENADAGKLLINLLIGLVVAGGVAAPWYFRNAESLSSAVKASAEDVPLAASDPMGLLLDWFAVLINQSIFLPVAVISLIGMLVAGLSSQFRKPVVAVAFFWPVLVLMLAIPYLGEPMARYLLPLIPTLGLFLAFPVAAVPTGPPRRVLSIIFIVVLLIPFGNLTVASYGTFGTLEIPLSLAATSDEPPSPSNETDGEEVTVESSPAQPELDERDTLTILRDTLTLAPGAPLLGAPRQQDREVVVAETAIDRAEREAVVREQEIAQVEDTSAIDGLDTYDLFVFLQSERFEELSPTLQTHARERYAAMMSALPATYPINESLTFVQADIIGLGPGAYEFRFTFRVDTAIAKNWQMYLRGYVDVEDLHFLPPDYRARGYVEWTSVPEPPVSSWEAGDFVILPMRIQADAVRYEFRLGFFDAQQGFFGRPVVLDNIDLASIPE